MVLEYLWYQQEVEQQKIVKFEKLLSFFQELRIGECPEECERTVVDVLIRLGSIYGRYASGYVMLHPNYDGTKLVAVELLPAGLYFLMKLSGSREYLFWIIMNLDVREPDELTKVSKITENDTYAPKFKLGVVLNWLESHWAEMYEKEKAYVKEHYHPMAPFKPGRFGAWENYLAVFGGRGDREWYPLWVIGEIEKTLEHSDVTHAEEASYRERLIRISTRLQELVDRE
jgi:hypothetical protein